MVVIAVKRGDLIFSGNAFVVSIQKENTLSLYPGFLLKMLFHFHLIK